MNKYEIAKAKGYTYDPDTGYVYGIRGKRVGDVGSRGYIRFGLRTSGLVYTILTHRFGFYCVYGYLPDCIDHIDRDKLNNRIDNLRGVTIQENCFNTNAKGYYLHRDGKYQSRIKKDGKTIYLGYFSTEKEAHESYLTAKKSLHKIE